MRFVVRSSYPYAFPFIEDIGPGVARIYFYWELLKAVGGKEAVKCLEEWAGADSAA